MNNKIIKLIPFYSEKVWGYEEWTLSTHKNGHSKLEDGDTLLIDYIKQELPIMVKIIKANDALSVQVHPNNDYSRKYENDNGKTECWYILEAKDNATLVCGIADGHNRETLLKVIEDGELESTLKKINVKKGDLIYIPSGTVHAIGDGIKLVEIQQSSDVTYRLYDWNRGRELHVEKSLDVIDYEGNNGCCKIENFETLETPFFIVEKIIVDKEYKDCVNEDFHSFTVIKGSGSIVSGSESVTLEEEDTIYIPSGLDYTIVGDIELLKTYIRKENEVSYEKVSAEA